MSAVPDLRAAPGGEAPHVSASTRGGRRSRRPVESAVLVSVLGLLLQVTGYTAGWDGSTDAALVLWYVGFVVLVAPYAMLLLSPAISGAQRLRGGLALTLAMHLSYLLSAPVLATRFDETLHVTTARMLTEGDGFFAPNPMLPVSPHFPGLELATGGVQLLTGLPLVACQILVVVLSRVLFTVALFVLTTGITRSTRAGGLAVLLYAASVQFYFFNAQYSYQTVAITMLMATLALLLRATEPDQRHPWRWMVLAQVCLAGLIVTHHLTSWITLVGLWALVALFRLGGERERARLMLTAAALATTVTAAWTALIAPLLLYYLGPVVSEAGRELLGVLLRPGSSRQLFTDGSGVSTPLWEIAVMGLASLALCAMLLAAVLVGFRGATLGRSAARLLLLGLAATYPALLLTRFSSAAAELGDRASTFVFMAMAVVVAAWLAPHLERLARDAWTRAGAVVLAVVLLLGGVILGNGPDLVRVPGPYLAGAEQRSVDSETIALARWAGRHLPVGSGVATDFTLARVLPNFADVVPATGTSGSVDVTPLFLFPPVEDDDIRLLQAGDVDFVILDTRLVGQTARTGTLFEGSSGYGAAADTFSPEQAQQFPGETGFDLVLDGPIQVYDVRSITGGDPTAFADRPDPGLPGGHSWWQMALAGALIALLGAALRPRWRGVRLSAANLVPAAVLLPALMTVGAVGVVLGFSRWVAVPVTLALAAGVAWGLTRPPVERLLASSRVGGSEPEMTPDERQHEQRRSRRVGGLVGGVVLLAAVLASYAQWNGLMEHEPLPPPAVASPG